MNPPEKPPNLADLAYHLVSLHSSGFRNKRNPMAELNRRLADRSRYLGLIRFRGHVPKGGYDVHDAQDDEVPATTPAV